MDFFADKVFWSPLKFCLDLLRCDQPLLHEKYSAGGLKRIFLWNSEYLYPSLPKRSNFFLFHIFEPANSFRLCRLIFCAFHSQLLHPICFTLLFPTRRNLTQMDQIIFLQLLKLLLCKFFWHKKRENGKRAIGNCLRWGSGGQCLAIWQAFGSQASFLYCAFVSFCVHYYICLENLS